MNVGEFQELQELYGDQIRLGPKVSKYFGVEAAAQVSPDIHTQPVSKGVAQEGDQEKKLVVNGQRVDYDKFYGSNIGLGNGLNIGVNYECS